MPDAEILAWREGGPANVPGWSVRVVPNRHPLLRIEGGMDVRSHGLFETRDGLGAHEVIVETPLHDQPLHTLEVDRLWRVLWAWRTRLQDLKRDSRFASVVIFKNHGRAAGARLDHAHSQLTAYPILPPALAEKVQSVKHHLDATGRCLFCDVIADELADRRRIICEQDAILAIAPFASRVPFETWLMPRLHEPRFEETADSDFGNARHNHPVGAIWHRLGAGAAGLQPGAAFRAAHRPGRPFLSLAPGDPAAGHAL